MTSSLTSTVFTGAVLIDSVKMGGWADVRVVCGVRDGNDLIWKPAGISMKFLIRLKKTKVDKLYVSALFSPIFWVLIFVLPPVANCRWKKKNDVRRYR